MSRRQPVQIGFFHTIKIYQGEILKSCSDQWLNDGHTHASQADNTNVQLIGCLPETMAKSRLAQQRRVFMVIRCHTQRT
ncbi:hypothetical protein BJL95_20105 [Methylomonas sp. LWB]|nr:hypothetical protein BJL95_20105 [Methylomonas sp. LWB]